jgi:hypothetical protein
MTDNGTSAHLRTLATDTGFEADVEMADTDCVAASLPSVDGLPWARGAPKPARASRTAVGDECVAGVSMASLRTSRVAAKVSRTHTRNERKGGGDKDNTQKTVAQMLEELSDNSDDSQFAGQDTPAVYFGSYKKPLVRAAVSYAVGDFVAVLVEGQDRNDEVPFSLARIRAISGTKVTVRWWHQDPSHATLKHKFYPSLNHKNKAHVDQLSCENVLDVSVGFTGASRATSRCITVKSQKEIRAAAEKFYQSRE